MNSGTNNLENLVRAGQLSIIPANADEIRHLLKGAENYLRDSRSASLTALGRFVLAHGAAHKFALAALRAESCRPVDRDGYPKVVYQALESTAGAPRELWIALDRYHDRRNAAEYEAAPPATEAEAVDLVALTTKLQKLVRDRIKRSHPELLKK